MDSLLLSHFDALVILVRRRDMNTGNAPDDLTLAVEIFERRSFDIEVSSFLSCAANGRSHVHHRCSMLSIACLFSLKALNGSGSGESTSR